MMDFIELFTESIGTLSVNRMRTGLAILGIVIGIGSVIALVSLGQASQQAITDQIQSLGANLLTINPGAIRTGAVRGAGGGGTTLTLADADALTSANQITTITAVSPEFSRRAQVTTSGNNTNTQIVGVIDTYSNVHKITIQSGAFITATDVAGMRHVAVIGPQVASDLFDSTDVLGKTIRISGQNFSIVGLTVSKGGTGFLNQDDIVYIPLSTAQKQLFGANYLTSIAVQAKNSEVMSAAQNEIGYLLLARHKLSDPTQADFSIFSQADILNTASSATGTFTTLLSGVAAISLLVGGIGIMNIMLVTVTERTREIGLRKALGAKRKVITAQFLIEAIILTFTGGVFGVVIGIVASFIISKITNSIFVVSTVSILLAFVVSVVIGIVFGLYPAQRAANLQPIEALRYE